MKILLTENQLSTLKKRLNENTENKYSDSVKIDLTYFKATYRGQEIDDILVDDINLNYDIHIEARRWGIKNIYLFGINGPEKIDLKIQIYDENSGDYVENIVTLPLSWGSLKTEEESGKGIISIGNELEITLGNDQNGDLVITQMSIPVYTL